MAIAAAEESSLKHGRRSAARWRYSRCLDRLQSAPAAHLDRQYLSNAVRARLLEPDESSRLMSKLQPSTKPDQLQKRHRLRSSRTGKSDILDAQAIAEAVLRERDRLPRYTYSAEREGIRLRFEQRDRLVRHRTEAINRLRSAALQLGLRDVQPFATKAAFRGDGYPRKTQKFAKFRGFR